MIFLTHEARLFKYENWEGDLEIAHRLASPRPNQQSEKPIIVRWNKLADDWYKLSGCSKGNPRPAAGDVARDDSVKVFVAFYDFFIKRKSGQFLVDHQIQSLRSSVNHVLIEL